MLEPGGWDALLHLGTMAILVGVAYLGIDNMRGTTVEDNDLEYVRARVKELLLRIDFVKSELRQLPPLFREPEAHVLLLLAGMPLRHTPFRRILFFIYRQFYVPFFGLYRSSALRILVVFLLASAMMSFAILVATRIWNFGPFIQCQAALAYTSFALFVGLILAVLLNEMVVYRLNSLRRRCDRYLVSAERRISGQLDDQLESARKRIVISPPPSIEEERRATE